MWQLWAQGRPIVWFLPLAIAQSIDWAPFDGTWWEQCGMGTVRAAPSEDMHQLGVDWGFWASARMVALISDVFSAAPLVSAGRSRSGPSNQLLPLLDQLRVSLPDPVPATLVAPVSVVPSFMPRVARHENHG